MMVSIGEAEELIKIARDTIKNSIESKSAEKDEKLAKKYDGKRGCFVTLTISGELRGCIGYPEPVVSLYDAIVDSAHNAAFGDPRFPPLSAEEFEKVEIEISILTIPEELKGKPSEYGKQIKIGRDGLIIRSDYGSGLLLPQVFTEYHCDAEKALEMTCQKAGLGSGAWKDAENKVFKFSAQVFKEKGGKVVEEEL